MPQRSSVVDLASSIIVAIGGGMTRDLVRVVVVVVGCGGGEGGGSDGQVQVPGFCGGGDGDGDGGAAGAGAGTGGRFARRSDGRRVSSSADGRRQAGLGQCDHGAVEVREGLVGESQDDEVGRDSRLQGGEGSGAGECAGTRLRSGMGQEREGGVG